MAIALLEIPVSGWTCLRTRRNKSARNSNRISVPVQRTLVDVGRISLLADLALLLLVTVSGGLFRSLSRRLIGRRLRRGLGGSGGFAGSRSGFGCHCESEFLVREVDEVLSVVRKRRARDMGHANLQPSGI